MKPIKTADRMPEPHQLVIVAGGVAVWTGSVWLSKTAENSGRLIAWEVQWWMPVPQEESFDVVSGSWITATEEKR